MKKITILILLFISSQVAASKMQLTINDVSGDIAQISKISPENYFKEVIAIRDKMDLYLAQRKRVCNGEFSILAIDNSKEEKKTKRRKLTKKERRLCISELKNIRVLYVTNMFVARKKYLDYLHAEQISSLLKVKQQVLKEIQSGKRK